MTNEELEYLQDLADRFDEAHKNYYGEAEVRMDVDDARALRNAISALKKPPTIKMYTGGERCPHCGGNIRFGICQDCGTDM